MAAYKVTKEIIETVKQYIKDFPKLTHIEIGKLCGVSGSTVSRIRNGDYESVKTLKAIFGLKREGNGKSNV